MKVASLKTITAALFAVTVGSALAEDDNNTWTGGGANSDVSTSANWSTSAEPTVNMLFGDAAVNQTVNFDKTISLSSSTRIDSTNYAFLDGSTWKPVIWTASDDTCGVSSSGVLGIADWGTRNGALKITGGSYQFARGWVAGWGSSASLEVGGGKLLFTEDLTLGDGQTGGSATVTISDGGVLQVGTATTAKWFICDYSASTLNINAGGTLEAWHIHHYNADGTVAINFNGGTWRVPGVSGDGMLDDDKGNETGVFTITVGEKGGTIQTDVDTSIPVAIAPASGVTDGGLTKTGSGVLTLKVAPTITGKISVTGGAIILPKESEVTLDTETTQSYTSTEGLVLEPTGTTHADGENWTGEGDDKLVSNSVNWDHARPTDSKAAMRFSLAGAVKFDNAYTTTNYTWVGSTTAGTFINGTTVTPVVWTADDATTGLTSSGNLVIANADGQNGALKIEGGAYDFPQVTVGYGTGVGYLEMTDGTLAAANIWMQGANGKLVISGGTVTLSDAIRCGDNNVDGTVTITGNPTINCTGLVKYGTGTLTITDQSLWRVWFGAGTIAAPVGCNLGKVEFDTANTADKIFKFDVSSYDSKFSVDTATSINLAKITNYGDYDAATFGASHVSLASDQDIVATYTFDSDGYLVASVTLDAAVVYSAAWKQDFEDEATYLDQITYAGRANTLLLTSDTEATETLWGTNACAARTTYDSTQSHCFMVWGKHYESGSGGSKDYTGNKAYYRSYLFTVPASQVSAMTAATSYQIEYDTALVPVTGQGFSGIAIYDAQGALATIYAGVGGSNGKETGATVYLGDTTATVLGTFNTGTRSLTFDPRTSGNAKYWLHVTVEGKKSGTYLTITRADGTAVCTHKKVADSNRVVTTLQGMFYNGSSNYDRYVLFDDVVVSTPTTGADYVWTGAAGNGLWSDAGNWTVNGAVPLDVPTELDTVTIPAGVSVMVDSTIQYKSITMGEGSKLQVRFTAVGDTFTIPTSIDADYDVEALGPFTVDKTTTTWSVTSRDAATFTWAGGASETWDLSSNWTVNGKPTAVAPNANDTALFENEATVSLTGDTNIRTISLKSDVTLNGGKQLAVTTISSGDTSAHKLVLAGLNLRGLGNASVAAEVELSIAEEATNKIIAEQGKTFDINGPFSGLGDVTCSISGKSTNGGQVKFSGNTSAFAGRLVTENNGNQRASHQIATIAATANALSSWTFNQGSDFSGNGSDYSACFPLRVSNATYYFGALSGTIPYVKASSKSFVKGVTLAVGARNENCTLGGDWNYVTDTELDWVATTATMTYSVANTTRIKVLGGGTVDLGTTLPTASITFADNGGAISSTVDPSALIKNSTAAIGVFVAADADVTWASDLASNTAGLTKKGEGTLTLSTAPKYTGATRIEGGKLVINGAIALADGSAVVVADPAAAYEAGTVYLEATSITGKAKLVSDAADAAKYRIVKKTVDGNQCLCVDKAGLSIHVR